MNINFNIGLLDFYNKGTENICIDNKIIQNLGISKYFANKISYIINFKNILIVDDTESMNSRSNNVIIMDGPFDYKTRWNEAKYFTKNFINLIVNITKKPVDVWFINSGMLSINNFSQIEPIFNNKPKVITPLKKNLFENISKYYKNEKLPLNINIITDGVVIDSYNCIKKMNNFLKKHESVITISTCTDNDSILDFLNNLNKRQPYINIINDYYYVKSHNLKMNHQDYIFFCLINAIDKIYNFDNDNCE
jgi:hypothetical protein